MTTWEPALQLDVQRFEVRLGEAAVHFSGGQVRNGIGDRPRAELTLRWRDHEPVDFLAPLRLRTWDEGPEGLGVERPLFTGLVDEVSVDADEMRIVGMGAHELAERAIGPLRTENVPVQQVVHMLARSAGLPEERMSIQGLEEAPLEVLQVSMPVDGLDAEDARLGQVLLQTDPAIAAAFSHAGHDPAPLYAVTYVSARHLFDAEVAGMAAIEAALDRVAVAALYGLSARPGGGAVPFSRRRARARPTARRVVQVMGVSSGRRWCRQVDTEGTEAAVSAVDLLAQWPEVGASAATSTARALSVLRRAADPGVARVERVQAMWDAIEYYAAGTALPKLLDKTAKKKVLAAVVGCGLTPQQEERVRKVITDSVNNAPLTVRLLERARLDGVPLRAEEVDLLLELRGQRNNASHGRRVDETDEERLAWAVSVVARLLLFRHVQEAETTGAVRHSRPPGQ